MNKLYTLFRWFCCFCPHAGSFQFMVDYGRNQILLKSSLSLCSCISISTFTHWFLQVLLLFVCMVGMFFVVVVVDLHGSDLENFVIDNSRIEKYEANRRPTESTASYKTFRMKSFAPIIKYYQLTSTIYVRRYFFN